jgi:nucleoid-associated protein YgaU
MSKDAKLGLVLGIGLVIIIAVVFFRKETSQVQAATETAAVQPKNMLDTPVVSDMRFAGARQHTVAEGDTLFSLAVRYYNDPSKFVRIYQANQAVIPAPDRLTPGTVLVIPE